MKKLSKITLICIALFLMFANTVYAWGAASTILKTGNTVNGVQVSTIDDSKIQQLNMDWSKCQIGVNEATYRIYQNNTNIDVTNRCSKVFKLGGEYYDIVFHYNYLDWASSNSRTEYHYDDGWCVGSSHHNSAKYLRIYEGSASKTPSIEWNSYLTGGSFVYGWKPDVHVDIDIYKTGTTTHISSNDIAFAVSDLDASNDGFAYQGNVSNIYVNKKYSNNILTGYSNGVYYFTDRNPVNGTYFDGIQYIEPQHGNYGDDLTLATNPGTVFIKGSSVANGHFTVISYFNNMSATHIELSGIVFIGSQVEVKYISDNTDDDLSEYNENFIGSIGDSVPYTDKASTIAALRQRGFVVVRDDFGSGKNFAEGKQTYEIHVEYRPQQAKTVFIDKIRDNEVLGERELMWGTPGENIVDTGYQNSGSVNTNWFLRRGYKLVSDGYDSSPKFDDINDNVQEIKVILEHTYTTVDKTTLTPDKCLNEECTTKQVDCLD